MPLAYSYIRFSTKKQADGDSLRRQTEKARAYARQHGLSLDESLSYQDLGVSAFDGSNVAKGQLAAFMQAVRAGNVPAGSFLLVEQFDRLSRVPPLDAMMQLQELISAGITVVTLDDGRVYDRETTRDPSALFLSLATMYRAYNESESKSIRISGAWQAKRARREAVLTAECPRWLTARADRSGFDIIPEKADSIRKVFELTIAGFGNVALARRANQESWPHPGKGPTWNQTLITKLVSNRAVLGEYQPCIRDGKKRVPQGEAWKNYYPAVITEELFLLANAAKAQRSKVPGRRDKNYKNLFQGILVCGSCGGSYTRKNKQSKKQLCYSLYMCTKRAHGLTKCKSFNGQQLEVNLLANIYQLGYEHIRTEQEARELQSKLALLKTEKQGNDAKIERIVDAIVETGSDNLRERLKLAEARNLEIDKSIKIVESELKELRLAEKNIGAMMTTTFTSDYERIRDEAEIDFRAQLREKILSLVRRIIVYPDYYAAVIFYKHTAEPQIQPLDSVEFDVSQEAEILASATSLDAR